MAKIIAIDPGMSKCGLIIADLEQQKVLKAEVINSNYLLGYVQKIYKEENKLEILIGNGTTSKKYIKELHAFFPNLIIAEEKNSTFRAKKKYFEVFPLRGLKNFLPREIFILNKNLDALAALVILEDFLNCKFEITDLIDIKTWMK